MNNNNNNKLGYFQRYRVNHDFIHEPQRYFDLTTLFNGADPTGGGDPIPTIGQFDHGNNASFKSKLEDNKNMNISSTNTTNDTLSSSSATSLGSSGGGGGGGDGSGNRAHQPSSPIWLRFEPFILHVMCHSLKSASVLMAAARPAFKNVGLTSWHCDDDDDDDDDDADDQGRHGDDDTRNNNSKLTDDDSLQTTHTIALHHHQQHQRQQCKRGKCPRYLVAIWGDEGLDMPLTLPSSPTRGLYYHPPDTNTTSSSTTTTDNHVNDNNAEWLASLVNERHARNWKKIERFVESMKSLEGRGTQSFLDDHNYNDEDEDVVVNAGLDGLELDAANDYNDILDTHGTHSTGKASVRTIPRSYDGKMESIKCFSMTLPASRSRISFQTTLAFTNNAKLWEMLQY